MSKNISLVLSGGGARGIAHIAVIEELEKLGYTIKSISGTSMGALIGGVYAAGNLEPFKNWLLELNKTKIFKLLDFSFSTQGLVKGDRIFNEIKPFITDVNIENLPIKYNATAFDIANNKEVVFDEGSLFRAIRASISIPTIFTPVNIDNSVLVDGGVVNNIPITNIDRFPNDILIAVNVNAGITEEVIRFSSNHKSEYNVANLNNRLAKKYNYFTLVNNTLVTMTNHVSNMILDKYPPDILIEVPRSCAGVFDFYKTSLILEFGRKAVFDATPLLVDTNL